VIRTWFQKPPEGDESMSYSNFQDIFVENLDTCTHPESVAVAIKEFCEEPSFCPSFIPEAAIKLTQTLRENAADQSDRWVRGIISLLQSCYFLLDGEIVSDAFLQSAEHTDYINRMSALNRHTPSSYEQMFRSMLVEVYLSIRRLTAIRREENAAPSGAVSITTSRRDDGSTRNTSLYTSARPTTPRSDLNVWELVLDNGCIVGLKINSRNINVNSLQVSTESGGITTLNLSVLIVPGRDILNVTNRFEDAVSSAMGRAFRDAPPVPEEQESNPGSGRNMRYMDL
jgi:hypothetical protein